jgi:hypothetical protein
LARLAALHFVGSEGIGPAEHMATHFATECGLLGNPRMADGCDHRRVFCVYLEQYVMFFDLLLRFVSAEMKWAAQRRQINAALLTLFTGQ